MTTNLTWSYEGHTYQLVKDLKTWDAANSYAKSFGGYLVKVDSSAENQSILNEVRSRFTAADYGITYADDGGSATYVWLGASDAVSEGQWFWSKDNSTLSKVVGAANTFWGNGPGHAKFGPQLQSQPLTRRLGRWARPSWRVLGCRVPPYSLAVRRFATSP